MSRRADDQNRGDQAGDEFGGGEFEHRPPRAPISAHREDNATRAGRFHLPCNYTKNT
jgi:hypothetical protein